MIDNKRVAELKAEIGEDDFAEVLDIFLEEITEALDAFDPAANPDRLAADLHTLKGSAQNIGFSGLADACLEAEAGATDGDLKLRLTSIFQRSKAEISP